MPSPTDMRAVRSRAPGWSLAGLALAAVLVGGCGGHGGGQATAANHRPAKHFVYSPGEGKLVDVGGGLSLNLACRGSGSPTVVIAAGIIDESALIRGDLAKTTRTCAYDRAGEGYSTDPARRRTDARDDARDLEKLLAAGHVPGPYVLVGFSYLAPVVGLFAKAHHDQAAGVVFIEGLGANFRRRFLALGRGHRASVRRELAHDVGPSVEGGLDLDAVGAETAGLGTLGDTPLAVISTRFSHQAPASLYPAATRLDMTMQDELAALSTDHLHVVATRGDLVMSNQPDVAVRAVRAVLDAARARKPLPPCRDLFRGSGVVCRS
jgi:pimeloyl-ACP methyl ester carboxylesterase